MSFLKCNWKLLLKPKRLWIPTEHFGHQRRSYTFIPLVNHKEGFGKEYFLNLRTNGLLYSRRFDTTGSQTEVTSSSEISTLLRERQDSVVLKDLVIIHCDVSQLASNRPSEDRWFASRLMFQEEKDGLLFGVVDGHGGETCAENISQRLSTYIAAFLAPKENFLSSCKSPSFTELFKKPTQPSIYDFCNDQLCKESYENLLFERKNAHHELSKNHEFYWKKSGILKALQQAFLQMDNDLHNEALRSVVDHNVNDIVPYLTAVQSGCCVLASYVTKDGVYIANTGDCRAVAGVQSEDGLVSAQQLSLDQTAGNPHEVSRILSEHPNVEADNLFSEGRLMGILAPLRAFGNAWLKWNVDTIKRCFSLLYGPDVSRLIPMFYHSPPYLTAQPEVTHYHLPLSGFKFLILATDGLWDLISNEDAVEVVENYLRTRGRNDIVNRTAVKESDVTCDNAATALVRHALGGENNDKLMSMLSLPFPQVRMYRDDITALVITFNN